MLTAWRIVKASHAAWAFSGEGAYLYGGRWNSPGTKVVYVASTRALATVELAVHLDRSALLASYVLIPCGFDERLVNNLERGELPAGWRRDPPPAELAAIGDRWVRKLASAVLSVPSAVIPEEINFLLNPAHPAFSRIEIGDPRSFAFDPRLIK